MSRKISATMATQHPDHASKPYWNNDEFITTKEETYEAHLNFSDLGVNEYKWDWEGKLVDESVVERMLTEYYDYFTKVPLGKEKFLTFRLPNPSVQTEFRIGRAFMVILSAAILAQEVGMKNKPVFEVILPMVETAEELIKIHEAFREIASLKHPLFELDKIDFDDVEMIPLFEQKDVIMNSANILEKYVETYYKKFKTKPEYLRPYVARSDPALNAGQIPTVLGIKVALSKYKDFEKKHDIETFPIIGAASLPFRGGMNPESVEDFANEYAGIRTTTIQSAFRYDYPTAKVVDAVKYLEDTLPKNKTRMINKNDEKDLREISEVFTSHYRKLVGNEKFANLVNKVAALVPKRRERVQHVGLFGYSRGVGKVTLPRAIKYTCSLYSLGLPPELIGTGRGLLWAMKNNKLDLIEENYINLKKDLLKAGKFVNKANLENLVSKDAHFSQYMDDITGIEKYLEDDLKPTDNASTEHKDITTLIYKRIMNDDDPSDLIVKAAKLRKSLG